MNSILSLSLGELKLNYLKRNYGDLAQQGSQAWLTGRATRFGGSEMNYIVTNKIKELIQKKQDTFDTSNLFCLWGNIFEEVAKAWLEYKYKYKIHEFGAIPATDYPLAYSPDGVYIDPESKDLYLLEIKCPFLRSVNNKTKIKKEYLSQIQTGMNILPCNKTNFVQFKFRRCFESQIDKVGKYDRFFHNKYEKGSLQKCLFYGLIYWETSDGIREEFCQMKPSAILWSFAHDIKRLLNTKDYGCYCYFKCFGYKQEIVNKDPDFLMNYSDQLWKAYGKLMEKHYEKNLNVINKI